MMRKFYTVTKKQGKHPKSTQQILKSVPIEIDKIRNAPRHGAQRQQFKINTVNI